MRLEHLWPPTHNVGCTSQQRRNNCTNDRSGSRPYFTCRDPVNLSHYGSRQLKRKLQKCPYLTPPPSPLPRVTESGKKEDMKYVAKKSSHWFQSYGKVTEVSVTNHVFSSTDVTDKRLKLVV